MVKLAKQPKESAKADDESDDGSSLANSVKPLFSAPCKFGSPSFGAETASISLTIASKCISSQRNKELFIARQLRIRISTDPNPSGQPQLEGMDDAYEYVDVIAKCNRISIGDADVGTSLKFSKNTIDPLFLVKMAATAGSISVLEVMEIPDPQDGDDELE